MAAEAVALAPRLAGEAECTVVAAREAAVAVNVAAEMVPVDQEKAVEEAMAQGWATAVVVEAVVKLVAAWVVAETRGRVGLEVEYEGAAMREMAAEVAVEVAAEASEEVGMATARRVEVTKGKAEMETVAAAARAPVGLGPAVEAVRVVARAGRRVVTT